MSIPDSPHIGFLSSENYMKRLETAVGSQTVTVGAFSNQTITVSHNLGHIPGEYLVQFDKGSAGVICSNNIPYIGMDNASNSSPYPYIKSWTDANTLTIKVYWDNPGSINVKVYWVVYMDYKT